MLNIPLIGALAPTPDVLPERKRDWRASLFDRLNPDDTLGLTDADKSRLGRQALLGLASGLLGTGGGFGNALGAGIQTGLLAMNQGQDDITDRRYKQQLLANQSAMPSEFRAADAIARASGFTPGTPEYQKFMRIQGGVDPRASSAAIAYKEVTGSDGRRRMVAFDPNEVSAQVVGGGMTAPITAPLADIAGMNPSADFGILSEEFGIKPSSTVRTPEHNRAVGGVPNSYHLTGQAADYPVPAQQKPAFMARARALGYQALDEGDHIHIEPPSRVAASGGANPFVSRTPEEEAAAVKAAEENARIGAFIANAGTVGEIEAANAAKKAAAEAGAKSGAELGQKNAQRTRDADQTLALLDEAEKILPSATGSGLGALRDAAAGQVGLSTAGAQATAKLNIISSQLVQKVPRFEGPQSNIDVQSYREAAGDLANPRKTVAERLAAAQTMRQLQLKYASPQAQEPAKVDQVKFQQAGDLLKEARNAIMRGAPKDAVRQRLIEQGFTNIAGRL